MSSAEAPETPPVPDIPGDPRVPLTARPGTMLGLLLFATALVFLPALGGEFVWDDTLLLGTNPYVRDLSRLGEALTHDFWHNPQTLEAARDFGRQYYRPVVILAYALQFRAFGEHPVGYHLVSLALHLGCVTLAFGWLRRRLGASADTPPGPLAVTLGTALFALHPSRPESVAWISGSTDLWLALFALLGLRAWDRRPDLRGGALAGLFFFLATLSKETAVTLPALLLVDLVLLRAPKTSLRPALGRWALASAGVGLALGLRSVFVPHLVTAHTPVPWGQAAARVLASFGHYLVETAAPWWPSVQVGLKTFVDGQVVYPAWSVALGALGFAALGALAVGAWRHPRARPWLADTLWFVVALGPTLNLISMEGYVLVAARFLYLPLLGVCALVTRAALERRPESRTELRNETQASPGAGTKTGSMPVETPQRSGATRIGSAATGDFPVDTPSPPTPRGHAVRAALGAFLLAAAVVCSQHAARFADAETLWEAELRRNPGNYYAYNVLAIHHQDRGDYPRTRSLLLRGYAAAQASGVEAFETLCALQLAHLLLWQTPDDDRVTLEALRGFLGQFATAPEGVARLDTPALRLELALPRRTLATRQGVQHRQQWAWATFRSGHEAEAEALLRDLVATHPYAATARRYLAMAQAARGDLTGALETLDGLLAHNPQDTIAAMLQTRIRTHARDLTAAPDDVARTSLTARLLVDLSRAARARRLLAPLLRDHPARLEPLAASLHAELADRRPEAAEALVQAASARAPAQAAAFRAALQDASRAQGLPAPPGP